MEPRTAQRIIYIGILILALFGIGLLRTYTDKVARDEGYTDTNKKNAIHKISNELKVYKKIKIITDNTMGADNILKDISIVFQEHNLFPNLSVFLSKQEYFIYLSLFSKYFSEKIFIFCSFFP